MLPNGATLSVASTFGAAKAITGISNAAAAVMTLEASHGVAVGDVGIVNVNWGRLLGKVVKATAVAVNDVTLTGVDTSNANLFVPGGGVGTFTELSGFTSLPNVRDFSVSGGEQQYDTNQWLDSDVEEQEATIRSAKSLKFMIKDAPSAAWYNTMRTLSDNATETAFKLTLKNGAVIFYSGVVSMSDSPMVEINKTMMIQVDMAIKAAGISRY